MTNLARIFPARSFSGEELSDGGLNTPMTKLEQIPFNSPTVFNYYPPDHVVPGTTLNAPEFALLNTASSTSRTNFLHALIFDGITANITDSLRGTSLDLSAAVASAQNDPTGNELLDYLNYLMMHGAMTPEQRSSILTAIAAVPASNPAFRAKTAIYLIAVSSQYQIQR
jgi:hypothetical protein